MNTGWSALRLMALLRMTVGSVLGILGFGTLSLALMPFNGGGLLLGLGELVLGTFLALGVLSPLRNRGRQETL